MSTQTAKPIRLGGVLYAADTPARHALLDFARDLQNRGWNVHGLTQELAYDEQGVKIGLDAIDVKTGKRYELARPSKEDRECGTCGFDITRLCETSEVLRDAVSQNADLLIVEKFGEREQDGNGLAEEIVSAAMAGIPTLVAVPASALEVWNDFTGRLGTLLPHDQAALQDWWPKWNIYKDLALELDDRPIKNIVIGPRSILVEGPDGCGVTINPDQQAHKDFPKNKTMRELASDIGDLEKPLSHAIAIATILAHYNRYDLSGNDESGLDIFKNSDDPILLVGNFQKPVEGATCQNNITTDKALQHLLENAYEGLILPSHTFGDGLLPALLATKGQAKTVLVGPETPISPRLFPYGLDVLCGRIIEKPEEAAKMVQEGASPKDLKAVSRYITLEK